jgi:hypothetical protein
MRSFNQLGVHLTAEVKNGEAIRYRFTSTDVEFHRFLPALTALENQNQLLRFVRLDVESPGPAFRPSATALNIQGEFEVRKAPRPTP